VNVRPPGAQHAAWEQSLRVSVASQSKILEIVMLRGGLLWLIGIPLPVILVLWLLGYLH
jgi:hypothetical protein